MDTITKTIRADQLPPIFDIPEDMRQEQVSVVVSFIKPTAKPTTGLQKALDELERGEGKKFADFDSFKADLYQ
ncbi:hypothetical protein AGMMS50229_03800 [Campylobacterota bacterium]|nr:hypothetical protein AGMMS50229_03800 [Campylobacterota bacterium]